MTRFFSVSFNEFAVAIFSLFILFYFSCFYSSAFLFLLIDFLLSFFLFQFMYFTWSISILRLYTIIILAMNIRFTKLLRKLLWKYLPFCLIIRMRNSFLEVWICLSPCVKHHMLSRLLFWTIFPFVIAAWLLKYLWKYVLHLLMQMSPSPMNLEFIIG